MGSRFVANRRQIPPQVGEQFKDRVEIWTLFGGQWVQGVTRFENEEIVNVFFDEDGPYADEIDHETGAVEYRGKGLTGEQKLTEGNELLENARLSKSAIRFWYKPSKGNWLFRNWAAVADRDNIEEEDIEGNLAKRFLWYLEPVVSQDKTLWPAELVQALVRDISEDEVILLKNPKNLLLDYARIAKELEANPTTIASSAKPRTPQPRRRKRAKDIVIARAAGVCENDQCTGMPPDVKKDGTPLFQVDHIIQLSDGGPDQPDNMIALCPNCHTAKTLGKNKSSMTARLKRIAITRHAALLTQVPPVRPDQTLDGL
jgi:5-methylcytosine-specific restriction protein A